MYDGTDRIEIGKQDRPVWTRSSHQGGTQLAVDFRLYAEDRVQPGEVALILFGLFALLIILRVPVAFALGLACVPVFFIDDRLTPFLLLSEMLKSYNSFLLLAIPFFMLAANLMPPYGLCLMIACSIGGIKIKDAVRDTAILFVPMLVVLVIVILFPDFMLWLPRKLMPAYVK